MKKNSIKNIIATCSLVLMSFLYSCNPEIESDVNLGRLRLQQFVALGDGYTAGYRNNALYYKAQDFSYPKLLSNQLNTVSNLRFTQPWLGDRGTGYQSLTQVITSECSEELSHPVIDTLAPDGSINNNVSVLGPYNNLGIPGLFLSYITDDNFYTRNLFFSRLVLPDQPKTYLQMVKDTPADVYTVWIGTEMMVEYAATGATDQTILPRFEDEFSAQFQLLIDTLMNNSSETTILIGNIPDITTFPFIQTSTHTYINPADCQHTPIFIEAHTTSDQTIIRQATQDDHILLAASNRVGKEEHGQWGLSSENPISDPWIIDSYEIAQIQSYIEGYNLIIQQLVKAYQEKNTNNHILLVDLHNYLRNVVVSGVTVDGLDISGEYLSGGLFALDGKYFTSRGNAYITNLFIEAVNKNFQAKVPKVNISDYEGVIFP